MTAPGTVLRAQRIESLQVGVRVQAPSTDTVVIATDPALTLSVPCQVSRGVALGLAGYLGYLVAGIAQYPLTVSGGSSESVAVNVAGAVTGVILIADAPMSRTLPFCPAELHSLANRPTNHVGACRASRVLYAGLGAAGGAVVAGGLAIPYALSASGNGRAVNTLFIALPAAGAIAGAMRAGQGPPCTS
ncbi:MAG: hypothetical protein ABJE47_22795 [bacterium]